MEGWIWEEGGFVEAAPKGVGVDARGWTHGLGVFETMLAVDGELVAAETHFRRLERSCGRLGLLFGAGIAAEIPSLLAKRGRQRVRLQVSAGAGPLNRLDGGGEIVTVAVTEAAAPPESVSVVWSPWPRNERSPLAGLKCVNYAENLVVLDYARKAGAGTALFLNTHRQLCEAATANVFLVSQGVIRTPTLESGCLPGTARERVLDLARMLGIEAREEVLTRDDVESAGEVFLTSAVQGVVPVSEVDGQEFETGKVARSLREVFEGK